MATYRDIFDTRDRLNPKIVERLRRYGNLEPPGVYGRPYNGGQNMAMNTLCRGQTICG